MNQDQDNVTTMFETTNVQLDAHAALWQGIPAFADAVSRVKTGTLAIREKAGEQAPGGDTQAKEDARDDLEERLLFVADQLAALAAKTRDRDLAAKVELNRSHVDRMAASDLLLAAGRVNTAAAAHAAKLASDYGVPAADLTALTSATAKFDGMKTAPRDAAVDRKVATLALPEAITFVRGIYRNELDKLMTRFRRSHPDFYAAYVAARIIVDRPATRTPKPPATPTTPGAAGTVAPPAKA